MAFPEEAFERFKLGKIDLIYVLHDACHIDLHSRLISCIKKLIGIAYGRLSQRGTHFMRKRLV
jgi:hypothetical protein